MLGEIRMIGTSWSRKILPFLICAVVAVACDDGGGRNNVGAPPFGTIRFSMVGDATGDQDFVALTDDVRLTELAIDETQLPFTERTLFPIGPIDRGNGDGGHNLNWNWHFLRDQWDLTDTVNPTCDGNAMIVDQAVDYWVDTVGQFCPADARVLSVTITQH
jgi:hypothetical protein